MYAIARTKKLKSQGDVSQSAAHNFRTKTQQNINHEKSKENRIIYNPFSVDTTSTTDLNKKLQKYYENLGIKQKDGNVQALEFVVTASPEFFADLPAEKFAKWEAEQVRFFREKFGDNLKMAVLHLDEKTPHIHFTVSTELKSIKKYKNRYGECEKESYSLNAKRFNPAFLRQFQTEFAEINKKFGLKRGIKGSKAKQKDLKTFYREVNRVMSTNYEKNLEREVQVSMQKNERWWDKVLRQVGLVREKLVEETVKPELLRSRRERSIVAAFFGKDRFKRAEKIRNDAEEKKTLEKELEAEKKKFTQSLHDTTPKRVRELEKENEALKSELDKLKPKPKNDPTPPQPQKNFTMDKR